jgi:HSP20 family protein
MRNGTHLPTSWNRSSLFGDFLGDFDQLFAAPLAATSFRSRFGATDVEETENSYRLFLDMPGLQKEDIKIEVLGNRLTVRALAKEKAADDRKFLIRERSFEDFEKSFSLGETADFNAISAAYEQGVLLVEVPKKEVAKQKTITVK